MEFDIRVFEWSENEKGKAAGSHMGRHFPEMEYSGNH